MLKEYTVQDILPHKTKKSLFVVLHNNVYDVTNFVDEHPGGRQLLFDQGGNDMSVIFDEVEHSSLATEILETVHIGYLKRKTGDSALWPTSGWATYVGRDPEPKMQSFEPRKPTSLGSYIIYSAVGLAVLLFYMQWNGMVNVMAFF